MACNPKFSNSLVWTNSEGPNQTAPDQDLHYRNDPKFSDRYAWTNNADPDQTAPRGSVWSGFTLFAIPSASFGLITLW